MITDDELAVLIICACSSRNLLIKHHKKNQKVQIHPHFLALEEFPFLNDDVYSSKQIV